MLFKRLKDRLYQAKNHGKWWLSNASLVEIGPLHPTPLPTWVGGQELRRADSLRHHDGLPEPPSLSETELREEMLRPRPEK